MRASWMKVLDDFSKNCCVKVEVVSEGEPDEDTPFVINEGWSAKALLLKTDILISLLVRIQLIL